MMNGFGTSEITFCLTKNLDKSGVAIAAVLRGSPTLLKIAACSTFAKGGSQADQFFPPPPPCSLRLGRELGSGHAAVHTTCF